MSESLAAQIAAMSDEDREAVLEGVDMDAFLWDWDVWSRPEQVPPRDASWAVALIMAGRGFGKSRAGSEWIREKAKQTSLGKQRFILMARTASDVREVLIEGDSGVLAVSPPSEMPEYEPSKRRLTWPNGNQALLLSADEPDQARGPQCHAAWADELATWRQLPDSSGLTAWDNLRIATRLGANPQILATTTPKRVDVLRKLLKEAEEKGRIHVARGTTADNLGNLSETYIDTIYGLYEGTALARQELEGLMMDAMEGALWTEENLDRTRQNGVPIGLPFRVIGVDPSVADSPKDECGIVVVTSTGDRDLHKRQAWVLEDASLKAAPDVWAQVVVDMAKKWQCPVVAEVNQGGALVRSVIHNIDPNIKVFDVHSQVGKKLRSEPISMAYQQGRVHHIGTFADLETQMLSWIPEETKKSPDRIDALVHALTALLIKPPEGLMGGVLVARSPAKRSLGLKRGGSVRIAGRKGSFR